MALLCWESIPFVWDTNYCQRPSMDVLNRKTLTVFNQHALDGILKGCASVKWPVTTDIGATLNDKGEMINDKTVYDLSGCRIDSSLFSLHSSFKNGLYIMDGKKYIK